MSGAEFWEYIRNTFDVAGVVSAIAFTGVSLHREVRTRRVENALEVTRQNRELWQWFRERPALHGLLDQGRDMDARPLTDEERDFVNWVLNLLRATFYAGLAEVFVQPDRLAADARDFFGRPAPAAAWNAVRAYHDPRFAVFVDSMLRE